MNPKFFTSVNELADEYPDIRIKRITGSVFEKSREMIRSYREQLKTKGYIHFSGYLPEKLVHSAVEVVDDYLLENGYLASVGEEQQLASDKGILLTGYRAVTHHRNFLDLVQSRELSQLMDCLLGEESATLDTKWVRVLGPKESTDLHSDYYRFKKLGLPLYTCWIPLSNLHDVAFKLTFIANQGIKEGTLAICEGTFEMDYEREMISQEELPAQFMDLVENSCWVHADFKIGDVMIFDVRTIHASFRNDTQTFRKNCDTRWMPKSKLPTI